MSRVFRLIVQLFGYIVLAIFIGYVIWSFNIALENYL